MVINVEGSKITARRVTDGRTVVRDASQFRILNNVINSADDVGTEHPNLEECRFKEILFVPDKTVLDQKQINKSDRHITLAEHKEVSSGHSNTSTKENVEVAVNPPETTVQECTTRTRPKRQTIIPKKYYVYFLH